MSPLPAARPRGHPGCVCPARCGRGRRPKADGRRLSAKQRGELAELAFLHRAASLGLGVLKPLGDSLPYDVAVDNGRRLLRVQVKSASRPHRGVYEINAGRGRNVKRAYTSRDIDFLAACIFPAHDKNLHRRERRVRREELELSSRSRAAGEGSRFFNDPMTRSPDHPILHPPITGSPDPPMSWFIFPLPAFAPRKTIRLSPRHPERWARFREAWHLLIEHDGLD